MNYIVSDRVSQGKAIDKSGPALIEKLKSGPWSLASCDLVPDEADQIQKKVLDWSRNNVDLILTSGGTGFSHRDVTPEAISTLIEKEAHGLVHLMLSNSLKITPLAALSRPVCGTINKTLVITLPGSQKGALENFESVASVLPHALDLIRESKDKTDLLHKDIHHHHDCSKKSRAFDVITRSRESPFSMISYDDALEIIMTKANVLQIQKISIFDPLALGTVLDSDVVSDKNLPEFRASIVDGYAVISSDGPGQYPVIAARTAGEINSLPSITKGQIVRITTGAALPHGADSVVMVEDTLLVLSQDGQEKIIDIKAKALFGQNIREIGSDLQNGDIILRKGHVLSAADIGILSSVGITTIETISKPRVAIFSSGNEIVDPLSSIRPKFGQIIDSNRPALRCLLTKFGFFYLDMGIVADDPNLISAKIQESLEQSDILITTGGVSMGERDYFKDVLLMLGATIHFGRVAMKPGKPTTFASLQYNGKNKLVFCLPGNPVSAYVSFHVLVLPCLNAMAGNSRWSLPIVKAKIMSPMNADLERCEFKRVDLTRNGGEYIAQVTGNQISSRLLSCSSANGLFRFKSKKLLGSDLTYDAILSGHNCVDVVLT